MGSCFCRINGMPAILVLPLYCPTEAVDTPGMDQNILSLTRLPLFSDFSESELRMLLSAFHPRTFEAGEVLFEAGSEPEFVFLLMAGSVSVRNDDEEVLVAASPTPIGELSAMTGEDRSLTAIAAERCEVLAAPVRELQTFLENQGAIGYRFQRALLRLAARKIGRDRERSRQMRKNIINTQKAMKAMRDALLESEDNLLHAALFEQLDALIENNRRVHYLVRPSRLVPTSVRLDGGAERRVTALSEEWMYFAREADDPEPKKEFQALLVLDGKEIPVSGTVDETRSGEVVVYLDELVPDYQKQLALHLTRGQLLDVVL